MCDGCGIPAGDAFSSGYLVPSHLGLAYVLFVEANHFPELVVIFPDYTRYFVDFALRAFVPFLLASICFGVIYTTHLNVYFPVVSLGSFIRIQCPKQAYGVLKLVYLSTKKYLFVLSIT